MKATILRLILKFNIEEIVFYPRDAENCIFLLVSTSGRITACLAAKSYIVSLGGKSIDIHQQKTSQSYVYINQVSHNIRI